MIPRHRHLEALRTALRRSPVTALLGPRQCGKTTLARTLETAAYYDLESPTDARRLTNPELVLGGASGVVVLDEIQRLPELFEVLRVLVDRPGNRARFLILGSASPHLIRRASETLAGRVELVELAPLDLTEVGIDHLQKHWLRGGFPRSFLAASDRDSLAWRDGFVRTFLERDIAEFGFSIPPVAMRRLWTMLAHDHGQTWNASRLGRSMGLSDKTVRSYLDLLTGTFMTRQLPPWFENLRKRQVRAPKVYVRDSGLLHTLLGLRTIDDLAGHPVVGASWEGFALEQLLHFADERKAWFWASHGGAELDLLLMPGRNRYGIEFKYSEAPAATRSMAIAIEDLRLEHLWIVTPGRHEYPISEQISVLPLTQISRLPELMR